MSNCNAEGFKFQYLFGIFTVSMGALVFEITLTRVCSISIWYHFAFLVISLVLLGFGASGAFLAVFPSLSQDRERSISKYALGFSVSVLISYLVIRKIPLDPFQLLDPVTNTLRPAQFIFLVIYFFALIIPFFFAGMVFGCAFSVFPRNISRIYAADLIGASVGCLALVAVISTLGGPACILASSLCGAIAAIIFYPRLTQRTILIALFAFIVLPYVLLIRKDIEVIPCPSKGISFVYKLAQKLGKPKPETIYSEWNIISRIDVTQTVPSGEPLYLPGLGMNFYKNIPKQFMNLPGTGQPRLKRPDPYGGKLPPQYILSIDADAFTMMTRCETDVDAFNFLDYALYSTAYQLKENPEALIIGLGGGIDVATALRYKAKSITGVEINPTIIDVTGNVFADWVGHLYNRPQVRIVNEEGRSFITREDQQFDIIQMSGVDTWSGLASGAYTLSENYLYTYEAFQDFVSHLKDDGILSIIRYIFDPPREVLRLCHLGVAALEDIGVTDPSRHIIVISNVEMANYGHLLMKKTPFTPDEIAKLRAFAKKAGFNEIYYPGIDKDNEFTLFLSTQDRQEFLDDYLYNISLVTDNKPFFYKYYKWSRLWSSPAGQGGQLGANRPIGHVVLIVNLILASIFSFFLIVLPLLVYQREGLRGKGVLRWMTYFFCLGVGFMFIEIALIQKFILFLGHPVYSVAVVLFTILLGAGIGSFVSGKFGSPRKNLIIGIISLIVLVIIYGLGLSHILKPMLALGLIARIMMTVVLLGPVAFLLGFPFPTGLATMQVKRRAFIPWAWGVNGCASVMGSILSVLLAMTVGFSITLMTACLLYLLALVCFLREEVEA